MSRRQRFLTGFCAGALALTLVQGGALADESQADAALWAALADGGKVMLIRHAQRFTREVSGRPGVFRSRGRRACDRMANSGNGWIGPPSLARLQASG